MTVQIIQNFTAKFFQITVTSFNNTPQTIPRRQICSSWKLVPGALFSLQTYTRKETIHLLESPAISVRPTRSHVQC